MTYAATRWVCTTCPFTTTHEDAARGHIAGPHTGRGWLGEGEAHSLSLIVEPDDTDRLLTYRSDDDFAAND